MSFHFKYVAGKILSDESINVEPGSGISPAAGPLLGAESASSLLPLRW